MWSFEQRPFPLICPRGLYTPPYEYLFIHFIHPFLIKVDFVNGHKISRSPSRVISYKLKLCTTLRLCWNKVYAICYDYFMTMLQNAIALKLIWLFNFYLSKLLQLALYMYVYWITGFIFNTNFQIFPNFFRHVLFTN